MNNDRFVLSREAMRLEQERCVILSDLDEIGARLDTIHHQLFTDTLHEPLAQPAHFRGTRRRAQKSLRAPSLKAKVLEILARAGQAGIGVKELAAELGIGIASLRAFFHAARFGIPQIKRTGEGRYRLESESTD